MPYNTPQGRHRLGLGRVDSLLLRVLYGYLRVSLWILRQRPTRVDSAMF